VRRFVRFCDDRHPSEVGEREVVAFLGHLVVRGRVAPSTQNQAASALLFLFRHVLGRRAVQLRAVVRAREPDRFPTVLTGREVAQVVGRVYGVHWLTVMLLYGSGLRLMEALRLRVKDVDLVRRELFVRRGKGGKDRVTVMPRRLVPQLEGHLRVVRLYYERDVAEGVSVPLPGAFARKVRGASGDWAWYWIFPSTRRHRDARESVAYRYHAHPTGVQRAVREAVRAAGLSKRVTCHTFRHCFAMHLLRLGHDIRTVQELLGHRDVRTTMIYAHVLNRGGLAVRSPADLLP
jgi:integron integrase